MIPGMIDSDYERQYTMVTIADLQDQIRVLKEENIILKQENQDLEMSLRLLEEANKRANATTIQIGREREAEVAELQKKIEELEAKNETIC